MATGEIKFDKDKFETKMGYLTMMEGRLSMYGLGDVLVGDNQLETVDKFLTMYEDIKEIIRKYKWALGYDIETLKSVGVTWENEDIYTSKYYGS